MGWAVLATAFVVGCSASPTPSPSAPDPAPTATSTPSASAVSPSAGAESPGPIEVPSRDVVTGGTLTVRLGEETAAFTEVQCDTADGLAVVAPGEGQSGVTLTVEDGQVRDLALAMPSGATGLVGGFAGRAEFSGDPDNFQVTGRAATITSPSAAVDEVPVTITGTCLR